ncbi:hypothetical protein PENTCL1PPCAC_6169, partial [Pristionchus entomophagus]
QTLISSVLSSLLSSAWAACNDAQMKTIVECYKSFDASYGITSFPPFKDDYFEDFHRPRGIMMNNDGIAAKPTVMKYGKALTECLTPVADCIEDSTFEQSPLNANLEKKDGHRFNMDRLQTAYQCTEPGYSYQMRHYFCLDHFKADQESDLYKKKEECNAELNGVLEGNHSEEKMCSAYNKDLECYRDCFADYCGDEAGEFYCELRSQEYRINVPICVFIDCKRH